MKVYNTLSRQKEDFKPIDDKEVRIYSCGPTVYNYAHIGNLRTYVFMDILRRVLEYNGYSLKHVMNITDVGHLVSDEDEGEDKMVKGAREQKKTPWEIAEYYTNVFMKDIKALNIQVPEIVPKATEHIPEMLEFVHGLVDKGYGYETSDGIYFDIQKFEGYGKLSRANLEDQIAGARVEVNEEKRHPADFAIWKKAPKEHIMQWPSQWGMGYPGWHIECSAMGRKYLGDTFDIHTGGVDHIPVHHENEIAQSEALLGKPAVNYWMHGEFMMVNNGKMSKSLGNTYTIEDLKEKGYDPLAFRYMCLNAHYRNKLNFTWDVMQSAQVSYDRFVEGVLSHKDGNEKIDSAVVKEFLSDFEDAINDDLNIPKALGVAWNAIRYGKKSQEIYDLLTKMNKIFGFNLEKKKGGTGEIEVSPEVQKLLEERQEARAQKNWKRSDEIRDELKAMGYAVEDTANGPKLKLL
ncbi:cysteine--tRNA ligase [Ruminiclostridium josui]|uniref:cysteine--tRNA ligase n=1 Tax=Ruminiclostridium josui TaxID=1499 RepID=UPI00046412F8|nr:cysteine--tRNA ligase [Ruminiclostridium josui]